MSFCCRASAVMKSQPREDQRNFEPKLMAELSQLSGGPTDYDIFVQQLVSIENEIDVNMEEAICSPQEEALYPGAGRVADDFDLGIIESSEEEQQLVEPQPALPGDLSAPQKLILDVSQQKLPKAGNVGKLSSVSLGKSGRDRARSLLRQLYFYKYAEDKDAE